MHVCEMGGFMRGDVLGGVERRRRWSDAEKVGIVCEVGLTGATVTQVAQRHEVTRRQIYAWRHDLRRKGLWQPGGGARFLPVDLLPTPAAAAPKIDPEATAPMVEIVLVNGRQIRCRGGIGDDDLARLIRLVEAA